MPGDEVIGDTFQPFLFKVWRWLPHMPRQCVNTLRGIVKYRANSPAAAKIAVRQVKPFEVGRERAMLREEDNILSNPVVGRRLTEGMMLYIFLSVSPFFHKVSHSTSMLFRRRPFM
ncbi:hypothetical protein AVEN_109701-1 [Araneus ventricosus]|uniref:Uncharacterized protein n=1 Tax=Araneus ventricosus TaxID=182803 RepID=A0A4Y2MAY7_ARAVE|nr:hypothetical protein AVEN_109701-1 [Araneus ventricosus]